MLQWHASAAGCHAAGQLHKYRRTSRQQQRFSGEKHEVTAQETVKCMEGMTNKGGLPVLGHAAEPLHDGNQLAAEGVVLGHHVPPLACCCSTSTCVTLKTREGRERDALDKRVKARWCSTMYERSSASSVSSSTARSSVAAPDASSSAPSTPSIGTVHCDGTDTDTHVLETCEWDTNRWQRQDGRGRAQSGRCSACRGCAPAALHAPAQQCPVRWVLQARRQCTRRGAGRPLRAWWPGVHASFGCVLCSLL